MSKQWRLALILGVAMAVSIFISACGGSTTTGSSTPTPAATAQTPSSGALNCVSGSITADGSTALQPLVSAVAKEYSTKCSGSNITVNVGGSKQGLSDVETGTVQIGNSDVFASKTTQSELVDHQVAVVIFTVIINSKVTGVTNLTTDQVKGIYSGATTNWNQIGGPDLPIVVVSRPTSSGTRATFEKYVLGAPEKISGPASLTTDSTGTVVQNVKQTSGAIGYAALGPAASSGLTIVKIDGNDPASTDLTKNNTYKFWAFEHMYTKGEATGLAKALIDYMASDFAKTTAAGLKFVAISDMSPDAVAAHQPK